MRKSFLKTSKGFSLIEVITAISILSILGVISGNSALTNLNTSKLALSIHAEFELRDTLAGILGDTPNCRVNLKPRKASDNRDIIDNMGVSKHANLSIPFLHNSVPAALVTTGQDFKNELFISKIWLAKGNKVNPSTGVESVDNNDPKSNKVSRVLYVHFARKGVGGWNTKGGACTTADQTGCYVVGCKLSYQLNPAGTLVSKCTKHDCFVSNKQIAGGGLACFNADQSSGDGSKTLAGCGTTQDIAGANNTALGFNAGKGTGIDNVFIGTDSGKINIGNRNVFIGKQAGYKSEDANRNVFIGQYAGGDTTDADENVFIGEGAGAKNTTAGHNVSLGIYAGHDNKTSWRNTFVGGYAGNQTTGQNNTFVGKGSGHYHTTGANNTFVGVNSGAGTNTNKNTGSDNVFVGGETGYSNTTGTYNTFVGTKAGNKNTLGTRSVFLGDHAGENQTDCQTTTSGSQHYCQNTYIGHYAGNKSTTGFQNVLVGAASGIKLTTGFQNVLIGFDAGRNTTNTYNNVFVGNEAGYNTLSTTTDGAIAETGIKKGVGNTFIGNEAGRENRTGFSNTFIGDQSGKKNNPTKTKEIGSANNREASNNVFVGAYSGYYNTTGYYNVYLGNGAGGSSSSTPGTGSHNVAVGTSAGRTIGGGSHNTFVGHVAGYESKGSYNTYIGSWAGSRDTDEKEVNNGQKNTYIGYRAGQETTTAESNTYVGHAAGRLTSSGVGNTFVGEFSGRSIKTGGGNTFVGDYSGEQASLTNSDRNNIHIHAGRNTSSGGNIGPTSSSLHSLNNLPKNNNIIISAYLDSKCKKGSKCSKKQDLPGNKNVIIGSLTSKQTQTLMAKNSNYLWIQDLIEGNSHEQWVAINNKLETKNLYASLYTRSDRRLKENIAPIKNALDKLNQLNPVYFDWKQTTESKDENNKRHLGFIAQDTLKILPEIVEKDRKGFWTIRYTELIPLIVEAFKDFQSKVLKVLDDLKTNIAKLFKNDAKLMEANQKLMEDNKLLKLKLEQQQKQLADIKKRLEVLENQDP